ncbi:hypothetical protein [Streptomyces sp. NPDC012508]|uniref:hypothetical protein n=1 Tax=Streptomyces sp. NPDC012508 TaxID=3364837 RepID=UPI00367855D2
MQCFRLAWTMNGERQTSAVSFSEGAARAYKASYEAREGVTDVEIVLVQPGE